MTSSTVREPAAAGRRCARRRSGAVTPGWSRTQARATSAGDRSRPSAARHTASTIGARARGEVLSDVPLEGRRRAARVSGNAGPVLAREHSPAERRPAAGCPGRAPRPPATTSRSMPRCSERVLHLRRRQPGPARSSQLVSRRLRCLPAGVVRDADVARPPGGHGGVERGQRLVERHVVGPGVHLPQVDVVDVRAAAARGRGRAAARRATRRRRARRADARCRPWSRAPRRSRVDDRVRAACRSRTRWRRCRSRPRCRAAIRRRRRMPSAGRPPRARRSRCPTSRCRGRGGRPSGRSRPR